MKTGPYNCCFIQIPRTGCGSINSIIQQTGGHRTASYCKEQLGDEWDDLFTFAFVRDPVARFVSGYRHLGMPEDINAYLRVYGVEGALEVNHQMFRPMVEYLDEPIGFIGRFERLAEGWSAVSNSIFSGLKLPHLNASKGFSETLNRESLNMLFDFYAKDFARFGYSYY